MRGPTLSSVVVVFGIAFLSTFADAARQPSITTIKQGSASNDCTPRQVHISVGGPGTMHVSWKTEGALCASDMEWWQDTWGAAVGAVARGAAVGYSFLLSEREMCDEPAAANPFALYLHRAEMTNLTPGARYRYRLTGGDATWPFAAPPATGPDARATFAAFGDLGDPHHAAAKAPGAAATLATLKRRGAGDVDAVLLVGDVSYANGDPEIWDSFMDAIEPLAARVPWMVQAGNHEYGVWRGGKERDPGGLPPYDPSWGNFGPDAGGECGVMLARRFHMPSRQGASDNPPFWYGFDYGPIHFTAISTEHDLSPNSPQHAWLAAELAAVHRSVTPWLVLLLHRPMYVVYPHKSNREVGEHIRDSLEPLLDEFGVDLAISGHVHSYYRTCAVYDGACVDGGGDDDGDNDGGSSSSNGSSGGLDSRRRRRRSDERRGTVHLVVGSAGHELTDMEDGQEEWVAAALPGTFGYVRLAADGARRLRGEFIASEDGRVLDAFEVAGPRPGKAAAAAA